MIITCNECEGLGIIIEGCGDEECCPTVFCWYCDGEGYIEVDD